MKRRTLLLGAGLLAPLLLAMSFADRLVYFPIAPHDGTPQSIGLAYEDVWLTTSDGVRVHGWLVPALAESRGDAAAGGDPAAPRATSGDAVRPTPRAARRTPSPAPVVLFLHGNAGNISHRLDKLAVLNGLGASVLLLDYRGFGASEGSPTEDGLYRDADAAYDWLVARGTPTERIVLYGESLGGAVAVDVAARRPVGKVVLESTPSSIVGVARHHYPFLPVAAFLSARYDAASKIGRVGVPILILHSPDDEIVPFAMAEELLAGANPPKRLVRLRGGHNDGFLVSGALYADALRGFLAPGDAGAP